MKILLGIIILFVSAISWAGNNDIYITQTGTGLTLTIDQIGATNKVGTSQARVILSGTTMTVDLDQIGDTNTIAASILQGNSSSWTYSATGDSNVGTFAVGATGDVASTDFDFAAVGDSNVLTFTQGDSATATAGRQDHDITVVLTGSSNNVDVDQTDTASTNVANIISTTTSATIDVDQCASGC